MSQTDPVDLLFGSLEKLGPGDDAETLRALQRLPRKHFELVVDVGCGNGRQTLALARALGARIHAVDSHEPFLTELSRRAEAAGLAPLIEIHRMDMKDFPDVFQDIDLLWCEGAAYNIGFANALSVWAPAIRPGGLAVVSELTWLRDDIPDDVRQFFAAAYPAMQTNAANVERRRAPATNSSTPTPSPIRPGSTAIMMRSSRGRRLWPSTRTTT